jgi:hypothetical protein
VRHEENEKRQKRDERGQREPGNRILKREKELTRHERVLGKRAALKAAFKLAWKEDEIQSLKGRIDQFRSQLAFHILTSLR